MKVENPSEDEFRAVEGELDAKGRRFAIVVSRFNAFITERLLLSACDGLLRCGALRTDIEIARVPGAFEIPSAARTLALTKKYDAIICLGCLLRGDTAHYDVIVNEVTRGIGQSAQEAHRIGLVNEVTAAGELIPRAEAIAAKIIANAPLAVQYAMEAVNKGMEMTLAEGLYLEATLFGVCCATEDKKEGTTAFLEKRAAVFKGK